MGKLIVIEGIDGSGKDTQTRLLETHLTGKGLDVLRISFPNYQHPSSAVIKLYLSGEIAQNADEVNAFAASSFYSVDRYVSFKQSWERDYNAGRLILCDRYTTSNITHQMEKQPRENWQSFADWLYDFEFGKLALPRPDLVVYLDMHPKVSSALMDKRYLGDNNKKDIHERDCQYLLRCRECALYAAEHLGWQVIRCFEKASMQPRPIAAIAADVAAVAELYLEKQR